MRARPTSMLPGAESSGEETTESEEDGGWRVLRCQSCEWPEDGSPCGGLLASPRALGCGLGCLLLLGLLAALSLAAVPPLHLGIRYDYFRKSADTAVFRPGRYLIGPFCRFLLFPSHAMTIEFTDNAAMPVEGKRYEPLHTRTKEGLGLHLQLSLQYRLREDSLYNLYRHFNLNYEDVFVSTLRDTLIRAASQYEATELWEERARFGAEMQAMVNQSLWDLYAECWGLQLLLVDLPDNFEASITRTQVQNQLLQTRERQQESARVQAETTVIQADYARQERVILARGQANYTLVTMNARAQAQEHTIEAEAEVLGTLGLSLGALGEDLVAYQRFGALDEMDDSRLFYGFGPGAQMLVQS